jgi:hypothetical protein
MPALSKSSPRPATPEPCSGSSAAEGSAWISQARQVIRDADRDFFRVSPARYWIDFLVSLTAAYLAAGVYLTSPLW